MYICEADLYFGGRIISNSSNSNNSGFFSRFKRPSMPSLGSWFRSSKTNLSATNPNAGVTSGLPGSGILSANDPIYPLFEKAHEVFETAKTNYKDAGLSYKNGDNSESALATRQTASKKYFTALALKTYIEAYLYEKSNKPNKDAKAIELHIKSQKFLDCCPDITAQTIHDVEHEIGLIDFFGDVHPSIPKYRKLRFIDKTKLLNLKHGNAGNISMAYNDGSAIANRPRPPIQAPTITLLNSDSSIQPASQSEPELSPELNSQLISDDPGQQLEFASGEELGEPEGFGSNHSMGSDDQLASDPFGSGEDLGDPEDFGSNPFGSGEQLGSGDQFDPLDFDDQFDQLGSDDKLNPLESDHQLASDYGDGLGSSDDFEPLSSDSSIKETDGENNEDKVLNLASDLSMGDRIVLLLQRADYGDEDARDLLEHLIQANQEAMDIYESILRSDKSHRTLPENASKLELAREAQKSAQSFKRRARSNSASDAKTVKSSFLEKYAPTRKSTRRPALNESDNSDPDKTVVSRRRHSTRPKVEKLQGPAKNIRPDYLQGVSEQISIDHANSKTKGFTPSTIVRVIRGQQHTVGLDILVKEKLLEIDNSHNKVVLDLHKRIIDELENSVDCKIDNLGSFKKLCAGMFPSRTALEADCFINLDREQQKLYRHHYEYNTRATVMLGQDKLDKDKLGEPLLEANTLWNVLMLEGSENRMLSNFKNILEIVKNGSGNIAFDPSYHVINWAERVLDELLVNGTVDIRNDGDYSEAALRIRVKKLIVADFSNKRIAKRPDEDEIDVLITHRLEKRGSNFIANKERYGSIIFPIPINQPSPEVEEAASPFHKTVVFSEQDQGINPPDVNLGSTTELKSPVTVSRPGADNLGTQNFDSSYAADVNTVQDQIKYSLEQHKNTAQAQVALDAGNAQLVDNDRLTINDDNSAGFDHDVRVFEKQDKVIPDYAKGPFENIEQYLGEVDWIEGDVKLVEKGAVHLDYEQLCKDYKSHYLRLRSSVRNCFRASYDTFRKDWNESYIDLHFNNLDQLKEVFDHNSRDYLYIENLFSKKNFKQDINNLHDLMHVLNNPPITSKTKLHIPAEMHIASWLKDIKNDYIYVDNRQFFMKGVNDDYEALFVSHNDSSYRLLREDFYAAISLNPSLLRSLSTTLTTKELERFVDKLNFLGSNSAFEVHQGSYSKLCGLLLEIGKASRAASPSNRMYLSPLQHIKNWLHEYFKSNTVPEIEEPKLPVDVQPKAKPKTKGSIDLDKLAETGEYVELDPKANVYEAHGGANDVDLSKMNLGSHAKLHAVKVEAEQLPVQKNAKASAGILQVTDNTPKVKPKTKSSTEINKTTPPKDQKDSDPEITTIVGDYIKLNDESKAVYNQSLDMFRTMFVGKTLDNDYIAKLENADRDDFITLYGENGALAYDSTLAWMKGNLTDLKLPLEEHLNDWFEEICVEHYANGVISAEVKNPILESILARAKSSKLSKEMMIFDAEALKAELEAEEQNATPAKAKITSLDQLDKEQEMIFNKISFTYIRAQLVESLGLKGDSRFKELEAFDVVDELEQFNFNKATSYKAMKAIVAGFDKHINELKEISQAQTEYVAQYAKDSAKSFVKEEDRASTQKSELNTLITFALPAGAYDMLEPYMEKSLELARESIKPEPEKATDKNPDAASQSLKKNSNQ